MVTQGITSQYAALHCTARNGRHTVMGRLHVALLVQRIDVSRLLQELVSNLPLWVQRHTSTS